MKITETKASLLLASQIRCPKFHPKHPILILMGPGHLEAWPIGPLCMHWHPAALCRKLKEP